MPVRLVVLISGSGTLLQSLIDACVDPAFDAQIVAVGADRDAIVGLDRARAAGLATFVCKVGQYADRAEWNEALANEVAAYEPDWVISAGFMKIVGAGFLARYGGRMLNTHPALLPSFPGAHAVRDALAHGVKVTGCTLFTVDEGIDTGPIIAQRAVDVLDGDTEESLHERIKVVERQMLIDAIQHLVARQRTAEGEYS
ncbi:phosphoribosylglycinamide formyltransferase-1 [Antricoccus suffuscus]|uniref:Phosphoribosylglycinamide formyltransferase n=1 Tax=Antricoccus suffuscus TaxID=1629062 RepID=A0A2T0ZFT7_9ACTN|nr:phosphoribosylglycinamide formyltransferase [Antricoccus suffuscus]PRZ35203.1 phosphoribosylglycinamide formyltransferase-1 [Antricoccus suffuscus]